MFQSLNMVLPVLLKNLLGKKIFCIVTRSLACFCRALGCCVRRLTALAISAFICPCPRLLYAWDSFWQFPLATPCTACTLNHWSCNPHQAALQKSMQWNAVKYEEHARDHEELLAPWVAFNAEAMHPPHVLCPCSNLSTWCDPFSSKTFSVKNQATNGKRRPLLHLLLLVYMNCQYDHNTTLYSATSSSLTPMSWETLLPSQLFKPRSGRLLLIRLEDHKEHICCLSRCAWLVWVFRVFSMVQHVPTAGRCPTILFGIVTRSLACFCGALGCLVRRLTTLAISAFICPCPKLQYAWDSFWQFPHAAHCTACTPITEAATLIKQLRKRPCSEAWGKWKEPWGFAGSFGSLQRRSYAPTLLTLSIFQSLGMLWLVLLKTLVRRESSDHWQEKSSLASSFAACLHELSKWPQHSEDDSTSWSFQTLAFARRRAPLLKCSDTVCLGGLFGPNGQLPGTGIRSEGGGLYRSGRRDASPWKQEVLHMKSMIGTHKPCKYIGSCPPSQICADPPNSGALESLRPSHWKAIIFLPESFRHRKLRRSESRVPQVPWLCRAGRENRKTCRHHPYFYLCVGVFVCMFLYYTVLSLNMKLWERFCLKLMCQHFKWISNCLPLVSMDGGSPTPPGNMIIYRIHSLYFFVIRFSSFEVVLNFIHHQYRSRLFLWRA